MSKAKTPSIGRRGFLGAAGASAAIFPVNTTRKLGELEVSSIGLGVQNMSRTYQTFVPRRAEMHSYCDEIWLEHRS